jgi:tetratricopeptide (TPR) repeat protein
MGIVGRLIQDLTTAVTGKRRWTPQDVRDLIQRGDFMQASAAVESLAEETPKRELTSMCLSGEIAFRQHRDADAEQCFRDALAIAPGLADAHYGLSLVMLERGEKDAALRHAQFAVNSSREARCSAQLGLCHLEMGNHAMAEAALARATRLDPFDKASWNNLGIARRARGNPGAAKEAFDRALEIDPSFDKAAFNSSHLQSELNAAGIQLRPAGERGTDADTDSRDHALDACRQMVNDGEFDKAINHCETLCSQTPGNNSYPIELFRLYRKRGDTQSGLDVLQAFLARHPDDIDVVSELARGLTREREYKSASKLVDQGLKARPEDVELILCKADILTERGRYAEAGDLIEKAFALDASLDIKGKLAANLVMRCVYEPALDLAQQMIDERPAVAGDVAGIQIYALTHLGRHDEAMPLLARSIEENPNDPNRRFPRATIHLLNERFADGWDDYAFRNLSSTKHLRMLPFRQWAGEPLQGKTILVLADQGLGDQVMFASCLPDLLERCAARVIVEVNSRAAKTIERSFSGCQVIPTRQDNGFEWIRALGTIDYFIPIGDLPQQFRRARKDFPQHEGYLRADMARVQHWRVRLDALGSRPKIGISWRGGTEHTRTVLRTINVEALHELVAACDADWVSLQYGDVSADLVAASTLGMDLHHWPEAIKDLDEFAALISALDLVVTVCNTTVHYAGALGQPVLVMAPRIPEWRYGLRSTVMPWYPSSRLYRQALDGDWTEPINAVSMELRARFGAT